MRNAKRFMGLQSLRLQNKAKTLKIAKKRDNLMQGCTNLSRFALLSRVLPGRNAKKYTGYCIIACVPMWLRGKGVKKLPENKASLREVFETLTRTRAAAFRYERGCGSGARRCVSQTYNKNPTVRLKQAWPFCGFFVVCFIFYYKRRTGCV